MPVLGNAAIHTIQPGNPLCPVAVYKSLRGIASSLPFPAHMPSSYAQDALITLLYTV